MLTLGRATTISVLFQLFLTVSATLITHEQLALHRWLNEQTRVNERRRGAAARKSILHIHVETWLNLEHSYGVVGQQFLEALLDESLSRESIASSNGADDPTPLLVSASSVPKYNPQWRYTIGIHSEETRKKLANIPLGIVHERGKENYPIYAFPIHPEGVPERLIPVSMWRPTANESTHNQVLANAYPLYIKGFGSSWEQKEAVRLGNLEALPKVACPHIIVRFQFPFNFEIPEKCSYTKLFVHGTAEYGHLTDAHKTNLSFAWSDLAFMDRVEIITPSMWSLNGMVSSGIPRDKVRLLPHGVNPFVYARSRKRRNLIRKRLGWEKCTVLLHVSSLTENKGINELLAAYSRVINTLKLFFEEIHQAMPCVRLFLKGNSNLYKGTKDTVKRIYSNDVLAPLVRNKNIDFSLESFSYEVIRDMIVAADAYVSPYRAEAFNLPALEAIAAGTPLILTSGGASDSFAATNVARKVASRLQTTPVRNQLVSTEILPDVVNLTQTILSVLIAALDREKRAPKIAIRDALERKSSTYLPSQEQLRSDVAWLVKLKEDPSEYVVKNHWCWSHIVQDWLRSLNADDSNNFGRLSPEVDGSVLT
eukprot:gb/GECG01012698.1/.p1 GENE.gb/GECG01012698.1/~~gb/GECG01012698.1/.p1  ORF type:complete len:595 (+),score=46.40 gb/GECG01012698.1/:1-1785(+)